MIPNNGVAPKVALIGVNGFAKVYVEWLLEAHRKQMLELTAVCVLPSELEEPSVAKLRGIGAAIYESYQALFAENRSRIDLCFIPTGIPWHARMTIAALQAGCNVLVEKPLAGCFSDALAIESAVEETGNWCAVGFQDLYTDEVKWLKESLVASAIGNVKSVSMLGAWPRHRAYFKRNNWAGKLRAEDAFVLDSPLNNGFSHFVNLSLFLAGTTVRESSDSEITSRQLYRAQDIESFDTAVVTAKSPSGIEFWFGVTHSSKESIEPRIRIEGTDGHATWNYEQTCSLTSNGRTTTREVPKYAEKRERQFRTVLKKLESPETEVCEPTIALCHTAFIEKLHEGATIKSVASSEIEMHSLQDNNQVPCIRGIANRLKKAFETRSPIKAIECQPANVSSLSTL